MFEDFLVSLISHLLRLSTWRRATKPERTSSGEFRSGSCHPRLQRPDSVQVSVSRLFSAHSLFSSYERGAGATKPRLCAAISPLD